MRVISVDVYMITPFIHCLNVSPGCFQNKGFVVLHPTSIFAYKPELLALPDTSDTTRQHDLKGFMSSKHQLLAYV